MADAETVGDPRLKTLMADTAVMIDELARLSQKLKAIGGDAAASAAAGPNGELLAELQAQFAAYQAKLKGMTEAARPALDGLEKAVRANPYVYIIGGVGLGFLIGKALSSRR